MCWKSGINLNIRRLKPGGYTTWRARMSYLEELAEPKIKAAIVKLLVEVASSG
jgi:hypothetical protein